MAGPLNAKVVIARCSNTKKSFGIRIEQRGNSWVPTWAFPIDECKIKREGFEADSQSNPMTGQDEKYPGCPHCGRMSRCGCNCNKIGCYGGVLKDGVFSEHYTCPWCGNEFLPVGAEYLDVSGRDY